MSLPTDSAQEGSQCIFVERYSPSPNRIVSPHLNKTLEYAMFQTDVDCDITVKCYGGNVETITIKGGYPYPYPVTHITEVTESAVVFISHNGITGKADD